MPTSWYWKDVTGTMLPPTVVPVLKVVTGIGVRSPMTSCAFCPSAMRSCGCASSSAAPWFLMKLYVSEGIAKPNELIESCFS